jgi:hypothetical protein
MLLRIHLVQTNVETNEDHQERTKNFLSLSSIESLFETQDSPQNKFCAFDFLFMNFCFSCTLTFYLLIDNSCSY